MTDKRQVGNLGNEKKNIPREKIPWFPTVNNDICSGCGKCVDFCPNDVYSLEKTAKVKNPYDCVVGCSGCKSQCPEGAISFPSLTELRDVLRSLRMKYGQEAR
jgi:NAD-dependent dihydropyrimidine dehydrogenase PreA subunit